MQNYSENIQKSYIDNGALSKLPGFINQKVLLLKDKLELGMCGNCVTMHLIRIGDCVRAGREALYQPARETIAHIDRIKVFAFNIVELERHTDQEVRDNALSAYVD